MIEAVPAIAKFPYQSFALRPADAAEARAIAMLQIAGDASWRARMIPWIEPPREMAGDLRRTTLDPRLTRVIERLRVRAATRDDDGALSRAIAAWSESPPEVFAAAENDAMECALRTERLLELDAPTIILDDELEALAHAIAGLRTAPAPAAVLPREEDEREWIDVPAAIVHRARYDLSLGLHSETVRVLEDLWPDAGVDLAAGLRDGEALVPFPALEAAHAAAQDEGVRILLAGLRFWLVDSEPAMLADAAVGLADRLRDVPIEVRAEVTRELDQDTSPDLLGGDFVASAEARLRVIAAEARSAASEGLIVLSEMSRDIAY